MSVDEARPAGGIYVHFPYCRHRCHYCDFALVTPKVIPQERYTEAVLAELRWRSGELEGPAQTLYLGGGTPSLWDPVQLARVVDLCRELYSLPPEAEVTLEANPEDLDEPRARAYTLAGVNRVSLGVQSLLDERLSLLDRAHDAQGARASIVSARAAGIERISLDLIAGTPAQSLSSWRQELGIALGLGVDHLSVYDLTVEPKTRLDRLVREGSYQPSSVERSARLFEMTEELLGEAGFVHYEVSSYARPGAQAIHNRAYWHGQPYLGVGAAAHGLMGRRRSVNHRRPDQYMEAALVGSPEASYEEIDPETWAFERVLTGLRDLELGVEERWIDAMDPPTVQRLEDEGALLRSLGRVRVGPAHVQFLDSVLLALTP